MQLSFLFGLSEKVSSSTYVKAIRRAFLTMMPVIIAGSMSVLINSFPLPGYQRMMENLFGPDWRAFAAGVWQASFAVIALLMVAAISYYITSEKSAAKLSRSVPLLTALVSASSFLVLMQTATGEIPLTSFGATALFIGLLWALFSSAFFNALMGLLEKRRDVTTDTDSAVQTALMGIAPALILIFLAGLIRHAALELSGESVYTLFYNVMQAPFKQFKSSLGSSLLYVLVMHVFWIFGIHGSNVLEPVADNIYRAAGSINEAAYASGALTTEIFTKPFFDVFVFMGGCGTTLALALALLSMRKRIRSTTTKLAPVYLVYSLFNINEPLVYGLPIVLNPFYIFPFILTPIACTITSAAATALNLVPETIRAVEWTTPILLGGYMATGSIAGSILQIFNLGLGVLIYLPFIKMAERQKQADNANSFKNLMNEVEAKSSSFSVSLINRNDAVGSLTRALASDMQTALKNPEKNGFNLLYQPIIGRDGRVFGCEALLRFTHPTFGNVPPPIVVTIAEEADFMRELGEKILHRAVSKHAEWKKAGISGTTMMVNLSIRQLDDPNLFEMVKSCLETYGVPPEELELEITESGALSQGKEISENMRKIREYGVCLSMDDFGMGHSSLLYVRRFPLSTIKIDGSLVKDVVDDKNTRDIISSIVTLCESLKMHTVAEYVETDVQRAVLSGLGVELFQGYFYSKPLSGDDAFSYIKSRGDGEKTRLPNSECAKT